MKLQNVKEEDKNEFVQFLAWKNFDYVLTKGQTKIVRKILFEENQKLSISAMTRYGKTRCVAIAIALTILHKPGKKIIIIGAQKEQANTLRDYLISMIVEHDKLYSLSDLSKNKKRRKAKTSKKKRKLTFKNGCSYSVKSAEGSADRLMSKGIEEEGGIIILDEATLVKDEAITKVMRMRDDNPEETIYVELYNPWPPKKNRTKAFEHSMSEDFDTIQIGWKQAVKEGRTTREYIREKRRELSEVEFQILCESKFPDKIEDGLISHAWIEEAKRKEFEFENDIKTVGVDVGEMGADKTVVTTTYQEENRVIVSDIESWGKKDPTQTVNMVDDILMGHEYLNVDAIGVGAGVASGLKDRGYIVNSIKVSRNPKTKQKKNRFSNLKAYYYWRLRKLFEEGRISLPENPSKKLVSELKRIKYDFTSKGKIKIIDPNKSPDFADSLMLACSTCKANVSTARNSGVGV